MIEYTELLRCDFSSDEWTEQARQLATATRRRAELEQEKKQIDSQYKADIEVQISAAAKLASLLGAGFEMRNVGCEILCDTPTLGQATIIRKDTGEEVRIRMMTDLEKQQVLDFMVNHPEDEKPAEPPAPAEPTLPLIEAKAYPVPVQGDMFSDEEPNVRRLAFSPEGLKQKGFAEIRFLEIGFDTWVSAAAWDLGYGKSRKEPLRNNITYKTAAEAILDAANLIFSDMQDFIGTGNRTLSKTAHDVLDWADGVIGQNGGPRTIAPEA